MQVNKREKTRKRNNMPATISSALGRGQRRHNTHIPTRQREQKHKMCAKQVGRGGSVMDAPTGSKGRLLQIFNSRDKKHAIFGMISLKLFLL
ncbi:hypothetical protein [Allofranklinella schreckenbergeri]|uniref:hypothetical protein n=1 Tax=Allofranklinella schreckenbergeri TaxID=1076744 RepID=UPI0011C3A4A9|nr:hypothetical protein [Allofranklinella schreckenbergeri]